jgi:hypothetical protein
MWQSGEQNPMWIVRADVAHDRQAHAARSARDIVSSRAQGMADFISLCAGTFGLAAHLAHK